jgi:hypothetical protein
MMPEPPPTIAHLKGHRVDAPFVTPFLLGSSFSPGNSVQEFTLLPHAR